MSLPLTEFPHRERRFRIMLALVALVACVAGAGVCATFIQAGSLGIDWGYLSPTPDIQITGTIERIAGIPLPADAVLLNQAPRSTGNGGIFDYRTQLQPAQIYDFYLALMTLHGAWLPGSQQHVAESTADFRFYTQFVPRLALFTVTCEGGSCRVHVEH